MLKRQMTKVHPPPTNGYKNKAKMKRLGVIVKDLVNNASLQVETYKWEQMIELHKANE